jgi:uncharacterized paraquat-inducible protein A
MNCQNCHILNEADALFCKKCGTDLNSGQTKRKSENKTFDILVFIALTYWFVLDIINGTIHLLISDWYMGPFKYIQIGTNLIYAAVPVFIALSIRNKGLKIPAIIFSGFISLYIIYTNIDWLFSGLY